ncbi:hypothetical protein CDD82_2978 [Ophiocordyceps australis]|uniref:Uncharacterized protein n=1 Tax=Ophiocordyceps australis TaxID=1399860 RepID=A0A2C5ZFH1_9HYPO|nr:hypothetical protein CDD82_2978 [Ophiocordyceps australis]
MDSPGRRSNDYSNTRSNGYSNRGTNGYSNPRTSNYSGRSNADSDGRSSNYSTPRSNNYSTSRPKTWRQGGQPSDKRGSNGTKVAFTEAKKRVHKETQGSLSAKKQDWGAQEAQQTRRRNEINNNDQTAISAEDAAEKKAIRDKRIQDMEKKLEAWKGKWTTMRSEDWLTPRNGRLMDNLVYDLFFNTWSAEDGKAKDWGEPSPRPPVLQNDNPTLLGAVEQDQPLPQGYHFVYFPLETPASLLALDGADAAHVPPQETQDKPAPSPTQEVAESLRRSRFNWRRLWAGGEIAFHKGWRDNLRLDGEVARCVEDIDDVKASSDGRNVHVHIARSYKGRDREHGWDIEEKRVLAFVPLPESAERAAHIDSLRLRGTPEVEVDKNTPYRVTINPQALHLFQFSALSYNAHAIHYESRYARQIEYYRRPLVHGPLILALVLRLLATADACYSGDPQPLSQSHPLPLAQTGRVRRIKYRNYLPLYVNQAFDMAAAPRDEVGEVWDVWIHGYMGVLAFKATVFMEMD